MNKMRHITAYNVKAYSNCTKIRVIKKVFTVLISMELLSSSEIFVKANESDEKGYVFSLGYMTSRSELLSVT